MSGNTGPDMSGCLSDLQIARWVEGQASAGERSALASHVRQCRACQRMLELQQAVAEQQCGQTLAMPSVALTARARDLFRLRPQPALLEIAASFGEQVFCAVKTAAMVLAGPGITPALRMRSGVAPAAGPLLIRDEPPWPLEVEIIREPGVKNTVRVRILSATRENTPLRFTLEAPTGRVESYVRDDGQALFSAVEPGSCSITISDGGQVVKTVALRLDSL